MTRSQKLLWIAGVSLGALVLTAADRAAEVAPYITPEGVTAQALGKAQGYDLGKTTASEAQRLKIAYADRNGLTLTYSYTDRGQVQKITREGGGERELR